MNIQAVNSSTAPMGCQPIRRVEFAGKQQSPQKAIEQVFCPDCFEQQETEILEQKYDLACRIAAYYKTQYENLLKNGSIVA